ncbi:ATP-binding protein [Acidaminobacter sp.]|uniref:ATP-binding protein n=1 Tax=Acidaminobacter sp. TaxID=1872102 RepID=UPI00256B32A2|nr:ATP-binding protein [Acidaminobacter sp.]MDK9710116.1 ATP-binding protein [Acidaminobacter sp.]
MFYGRSHELDFLNQKYNTKQAEFVVLYGRRRIGKTSLIREFIKDKRHFFYSAVQVTDNVQLSKVSELIFDTFGKSAYMNSFEDWEKALNYLGDLSEGGEKIVIAIDEFPYMAQGNPSLASVLQKVWDLSLSHKNVMMVLCGSAMSFMEHEVLGEKNPLYGRTTGIIKLNELDFDIARQFFGAGNITEHLKYFAVFSGVPYYLQMINPDLTFEQNLLKNIFSVNSVLFNETEFLLKQELREVAQYNAIVESIAHGDTRLNDIFMKTGIEKTKLPYYIGNLIDLGIVRREFPADMKDKEKSKSKSGLYKLDNGFFRFYYAFVYPYMSAILEGNANIILEEVVTPRVDEYIAYEFENVVRRHVQRWAGENKLPIRPVKVGRWWAKDQEIDVMGIDLHGNLILGECKWQLKKMGLNHLNQLKIKAENFDLNNKKVYFMLFSKSGFTEELTQVAESEETLILCDYSGEEVRIIKA